MMAATGLYSTNPASNPTTRRSCWFPSGVALLAATSGNNPISTITAAPRTTMNATCMIAPNNANRPRTNHNVLPGSATSGHSATIASALACAPAAS